MSTVKELRKKYENNVNEHNSNLILENKEQDENQKNYEEQRERSKLLPFQSNCNSINSENETEMQLRAHDSIQIIDHKDIHGIPQNESCMTSTWRKYRDLKSITQPESDQNTKENIKYYSQPQNNLPNSINFEDNVGFKTSEQDQPKSHGSVLEHVLEELVATEESFVSKLKSSYENYKKIFENQQVLPKNLVGKNYVLFRTIDEILEFHENEMLEMLQRNQFDLEKLCLSFIKFIEDNKFYPHVMYVMHKRRAENLCASFKHFFDGKAKEFNDSLGIMSFLIQPIHRVTKYPLLFQQIMKDCFKNYHLKPILGLCCRTEKKISDYVKLINDSERVGNITNIENNINLYEEGRLLKVDKFYVYDYNLERRFKARIFLFEKSLVFTEIFKKLNSEKLIYRGIFPCNKLAIAIKEPGFTLYININNSQECDLEAKSEDIKKSWIDIINNIIIEYFEKKILHSKNSDNLLPYGELFSYRFVNRFKCRFSSQSIASSSSLSRINVMADQIYIVSTDDLNRTSEICHSL